MSTKTTKPAALADTGIVTPWGRATVDDRGYYRLTSGPRAGERVHVLLVEEALGHAIPDGHEVHHKNFVKTDNRLKNLQVLTVSAHRRLHALRSVRDAIRDKAGRFLRRSASFFPDAALPKIKPHLLARRQTPRRGR